MTVIDDAVWVGAVGREIAAATSVRDDGKTLWVRCRDRVWRSELAKRTADIAARLPQRTIEFHTGSFDDLSYKKYLQTGHWRKMRAAALEASDGRCALDTTHPAEHVHHRTYERLGRERLDDLIVLCASCHSTFHNRTRRG